MTASTNRPKADPESGYAMLLVFLMAAMIAIALYREMPRVAFEAQRSKEQLLIERGEQYKRAIQVFVRKVNRYPATIEELESLNNMRFLRKRYVDPMTGKDKWRLVHINGGVLTDSIIPKNQPGQGPQQPANTNTFIGEGPIMGASNDPNQQQINPALRRRASDDRSAVTQEVAETPAQPDPDAETSTNDSDNNDNNDNNNNNNDTTPAPGTPGAAVANPGMPNQQMPGMPPGRLQQPGMYPPGANPGQPGYNPAMANQPFGTPNTMSNQASSMGVAGGFPNNNGQTGQSGDQSSGSSVYVAPSLGQAPSANTNTPTGYPPQQAGGMPGQQPGGFPGRPGMFPGQQGAFPGQQGAFPGQPQSAFSGQSQGGFGGQMSSFGPGGNVPTGQSGSNQSGPNMSTFGLTGPSAMQPPQGGGLPGMGGTQMGGGIAGVASESTGPAIKVYNERKKYNEWEFVYDQSKDRGLAGVQRGGGAPGTPAGQMGSMPGQPGQQPGMGGAGGPGGPGTVSGGLFGGQSSSFGQSSGFGQQGGFGQSTPQQPQPQPQPQQPPN